MQSEAYIIYDRTKRVSEGRRDVNGDLIEFRLSFYEWLKIWEDSGHWQERGPRKNQYVMSRYNDVGHYEIGNVFIQRSGDNVAESNRRRLGKAHPLFGKPVSVKHLAAASDVGKAASKIIHTCPHCDKVGQGISMLRWHMSNCRHNPTKE